MQIRTTIIRLVFWILILLAVFAIAGLVYGLVGLLQSMPIRGRDSSMLRLIGFMAANLLLTPCAWSWYLPQRAGLRFMERLDCSSKNFRSGTCRNASHRSPTYKFFANTIPCSIERKPKRSRRVIVGCWSAEA